MSYLQRLILLRKHKAVIKEAHELVTKMDGDIRALQCTDEEQSGILDADAYYRFTRSLTNKQFKKEIKELEKVLHI